MALLTGDLSFAWTGDYDALKVFVVDDLKLNGNWEQPGGDKKVFKFNNSSGDAVNAFIDVNEANNLDAFEPRNCADRSNAATQSGNLANRKSTSIPKHLVPCPFLRRGHCLKGGKCDFSHNINVQQPFQFPQQRTLPLNFPQPLMNYPIYHPFLNFPYPQPLMDIPTRPFRC